MKITWQSLLTMIVMCLAFHSWAKPSVYDLAGRWNGNLEVGKFKLRILLKIVKEADGHLAASMDIIDQGARDLPIAALLFNDPDVRLEFDQFGAAFNGALSSDRNEIKGAIDEGPGGKPITLTFKRALEDAKPEPPKTYTFNPGEAHDLRGYWIATLKPAPDMALRIGLKIGRKPDGTFEALMDSLDQGAKDIPASALTVTERKAKLEWQAMQLVFEAELDAQGDRLSGDWKQGPKPMSVTFERVDKPVTVLADDLSFEPDPASLQDLRGYWKGALEIPEQKLRLALKIGRAPDGSYAGTLASLDQGGQEFPLSTVTVTNANVRLELKMLRAVYTGILTNESKAIDGKWEQMGNPLPLKLERASAPETAPKRTAK